MPSRRSKYCNPVGVFDHLIATEVDPTGGGTYTQIQHYALDVSPEIPVAGVPGTALAQPDLVFDGNGNLIRRNLVALDPSGVDAVMVQGAVSSPSQGDTDIFVAYDNLGTPRDDVDTTGTLVNHKVFAVFGQDVYDSNPSVVNWAGFAGGHVDPNTGLVIDYHRWNDLMTGRWLSEDPAGFAAGDTNLDRYIGNSPMSDVDVLGLAPTYTLHPEDYQSAMKAHAQLEAVEVTVAKQQAKTFGQQQRQTALGNAALLKYMDQKQYIDFQKYYHPQKKWWFYFQYYNKVDGSPYYGGGGIIGPPFDQDPLLPVLM